MNSNTPLDVPIADTCEVAVNLYAVFYKVSHLAAYFTISFLGFSEEAPTNQVCSCSSCCDFTQKVNNGYPGPKEKPTGARGRSSSFCNKSAGSGCDKMIFVEVNLENLNLQDCVPYFYMFWCACGY